MTVVYHPAVQSDVSKILRHYDGINARLGDEFWSELNSFIAQAAANPQRFHFEARGRRRVNLKRFPIISFSAKSPAAFVSQLSDIITGIPTLELRVRKPIFPHFSSKKANGFLRSPLRDLKSQI
jgi:hypothetical protein